MAEMPTQVGRVVELWRYPVKSMAGERVPSAVLGPLGAHADRTWAVRDRATDATTGAKRLPGLLNCAARYVAPPGPDAGPGKAPEVLITFPDGAEVSSSDPAVHGALSAYLDRDVELRALPALADRAQYRGSLPTGAGLREAFGLDPGEPIPDLSMLPVRKLAELTRYATPVGSYVDAYPVHLLSVESLRSIAGYAPGSDVDARRFRPTMVVETGSGREFPEWDWCGGELRTPGAALAPQIPTVRCVMPSHEQPGLARDREVTRALTRRSNRCLGVYATVSRPGAVAVGDPLTLAPARARPALIRALGDGASRLKRAVMRAGTAAMPAGRSAPGSADPA